MKLFLTLALCIYSVYADISSDLEPLTEEMIKAINALNTTWKAGKNFNGPSSINELIATQKEEYLKNVPRKLFLSYDLPEHFDARAAWPNCTSIGQVFDQRKGYTSWIYTAVGQIADRLCIKTGVQIDIEATVDQIMRTNGGSNREFNSANIIQAFNYWSKNGIFTAEMSSTYLPLSGSGSNHIKLKRYFKLSIEIVHYAKEIMQDLKLNGPVSSYIEVLSDFPSYKTGIYKRSSKKLLGIHNLKLIGWGVENGVDYWLATNSWGTEWGDKGLIKINRGAPEFGSVPSLLSISFEPVDNIEDIPRTFADDQVFYLA